MYIYVYTYISIYRERERYDTEPWPLLLESGPLWMGRGGVAQRGGALSIYLSLSLSLYIYIYIHIMCVYIYIYIYINIADFRRDIERDIACSRASNDIVNHATYLLSRTM